MTSRLYTREEMVDAYCAGRTVERPRVDHYQLEQAAQRYVDRLPNARPVPENAVLSDSSAINMEQVAQGAGSLYQTKRESPLTPGMAHEDLVALVNAHRVVFDTFVRKTIGREVAMVKALVRITMESMLRFQYRPVERVENGILWVDHENAFADSFDWMTSHLNTYFPELTEEA